MRHLGFRTKLTLWYAIILIFLINALCAALYIAVDKVATANSNKTAIDTADLLVRSIVNKNDQISFELSDVDRIAIGGGLYAFYDVEGAWRDGNSSQLIDIEPILEHPNQAHREHGTQLIYDRPVFSNNSFLGTIRVLLPNTEHMLLMKLRILWAALFLPGVVLSFLIGRIIASRAVKPLQSMAKTAIEIGDGNLSKRIKISGQQDEIGELAKAFNEMANGLEQAFNREKQFTSDASHEMRTPVAVIIANAEDAKNDDSLETYRKTNEIILEKSKELHKMLIQLLMLARASQQAELMEIEAIDLYTVIKNLAEEAKIWAEEKDIAIKTELEDGIFIEADLMLFTRMMVNLLQNAVKYGKQCGYVIIKSERQGENVLISVRDNGIGIAEKDIPHVFKRFYKVDESRTGDSAGLGLSFADMIVQLHNGKIYVTSKLGAGTCFFIEMPTI